MDLLPLEIREKVWDEIAKLLVCVPDLNARAIMVQTYISQGGPVPDSRGDKIRSLLKSIEVVK
jgi:hypothetical protein